MQKWGGVICSTTQERMNRFEFFFCLKGSVGRESLFFRYFRWPPPQNGRLFIYWHSSLNIISNKSFYSSTTQTEVKYKISKNSNPRLTDGVTIALPVNHQTPLLLHPHNSRRNIFCYVHTSHKYNIMIPFLNRRFNLKYKPIKKQSP